MNGAIQVYSEPGKGTEFKIYFPIEKSSFDKQSIQILETIQGGIERILLVDDEDAIITMEKLMLERYMAMPNIPGGFLDDIARFCTNKRYKAVAKITLKLKYFFFSK